MPHGRTLPIAAGHRDGRILAPDRVRPAAGCPCAQGLHRPDGLLGAQVADRPAAVAGVADFARAEADASRRPRAIRCGPAFAGPPAMLHAETNIKRLAGTRRNPA
jgi:hypothetical protein